MSKIAKWAVVLLLAGCGVTEPIRVPLGGHWLFAVEMTDVPLTWTLDAHLDGYRGTGYIEWTWQNADGTTGGGEYWTVITDIQASRRSVYFSESGCGYLLTLRDRDHLEGSVSCNISWGTVVGERLP